MNLALAFALSLLVVWYCCKPSRGYTTTEWISRCKELGIGTKK